MATLGQRIAAVRSGGRCAIIHPRLGQCTRPFGHDARDPRDGHTYAVRFAPRDYTAAILGR